MAERDLSIRVTATTNEATRALNSFGKHVDGLAKGWSRSLSSLASPLTGLLTGAGIIAAGREVIKFEDSLRSMGRSAGLTKVQVLTMKQAIQESSMASGAATEEVSSLSASALRVSKDFGFVTENMTRMSGAMKGAGVSGEAMGEFFGYLHGQLGMTGKEAEDMAAKLFSLSQQKGVETKFSEFMPNAGKMIEDYKNAFPNAKAKEVGDFLSQELFIGNSGVLLKAQQMVFKNLGKNKSEVKALGFKGAPQVMQVIEKLIKGAKDETTAMAALYPIFGKTSAELFKLVTGYKEYKDAMANIDPSALGKASKDAGEDFTSSLNKLKTAFLMVADTALVPLIEKLSKWTSTLTADKVEAYIETLKKLIPVVKTLTVLYAAWKGFEIVKGIAGSFGVARQGKGGLGLGQLGTASNPMFVTVVGGGLTGTGAGGGIPGLGKGGLGGLSPAALLGALPPVALAGIATALVGAGLFGAWKINQDYIKSQGGGAEQWKGPPEQTEAEKYNLFNPPSSPGNMTPVNGDVKVDNNLSIYIDESLKPKVVTLTNVHRGQQFKLDETVTSDK